MDVQLRDASAYELDHNRKRAGPSIALSEDDQRIDNEIFDSASDSLDAIGSVEAHEILHHPRLYVLLLHVVMCDTALARFGSAQVQTLLRDNPDLRELLADVAWNGTTWKHVRDHRALQRKQCGPARNTIDVVDGRLADILATKKAWSTPFRGNCHEVVYHAITEINRTGNAATPNFVSYVQSSGTGKSRTVDEMAKLVFTLPFNLRHMRPMNGLPPDDGMRWPPGDVSVLCFFTERVYTAEQLTSRFLSFLTKLFELVRDAARMLTCHIDETFPEAWRRYLEEEDGSKRKHLYEEAVDISDYLQRGTPGHAQTAARALIEIIDSKTGADNIHNGAKRTGRRVKMLLYVDVSDSLMVNTVQGTANMTPYDILCSCFKNLAGLDCFLLFLSTNPRLSKRSPASHLWSSALTRSDRENQEHAPIVESVFDVWGGDNGIVRENQLKLSEACKPEFMVRFGRPLFWTRWEGGDLSVKQNIFEFARMKLSGVRNARDIDSVGLLAALAVRISLDFGNSRSSAVATEGRLVEAHMRIAFSVPKHREYLRSGSPSEPILAEAAALIMAAHSEDANVWATFLGEQIDNGVIDKGQAGHLVMRLLLTCAHDKAVSICRDSRPTREVGSVWDVPVPFATFLEGLFGKEHADVILDSYPNNLPPSSSKPMREAFESARIRFSHFVKTYDYSIVTDDAMWAALARGIAYQCGDGQGPIDIIIPILLSDDKLGRFAVTALLIQVRETAQAQRPIIDIDELNFFTEHDAPAEAKERPVIVFVANLGERRHSSDVVQSLTVSGKAGRTKRSKTGQDGEEDRFATGAKQRPPFGRPAPGPTHVQPDGPTRATRSSHPCYAFEVTGCSPKVYAVIGEQGKEIWPRLLCSRDLLDEHPRQTSEALQNVLGLKPVWSANLYSYDWVAPQEGAPNDRLHRPDQATARVALGGEAHMETEQAVTRHNSKDDDSDHAEEDEGLFVHQFGDDEDWSELDAGSEVGMDVDFQ